jgi:hypothetical protein
VTFAYDGPENWRGFCHCDSCRRACAAPVTAFMGVPDGQWRWTGATPRDYASSPGVLRQFCPNCGSQVSYRSKASPGEIHFYAALLDDPEDFAPTTHYHYDEHLPWLALTDDLKKKTEY